MRIAIEREQGFKACYITIYRGVEVKDGRGRTYNHIIMARVGDDLRRLDEDALVSHLGNCATGGKKELQRAALLTILKVKLRIGWNIERELGFAGGRSETNAIWRIWPVLLPASKLRFDT